jgi:hypothetical protein
MARGRILLGHGVATEGVRYANRLQGWMNPGCGVWVAVGGVHWTSVYQMPAEKKHGGQFVQQSSFQNTLGTEFLGTLELVRFITKSKNSVPIGTLFQRCSEKNTFLIMQKWAISCSFSRTFS